jgi:phage shock protein PspC (stress-responsive transcriptional regulator)
MVNNFMNKRLTKSSSNRMISGVVGGIGEYFGLDESVITIIRIVWAVITFMGVGTPLLIYIVMAIVLPSSNSRQNPYQRSSYERPWEKNSQNFYQSNPDKYQTDRKIKEAEPVSDDDKWSDF